ncbi:MAG: TlpA family protein disulfide reductase [Pseudomonadales bacterium]|nr:TlpA family protein disulfide reductase [Pseudomonadales bacterium]
MGIMTRSLVAAALIQMSAGIAIAGEPLDLAKYKGKQAVYLDFWASWCVPCRESFPWLNNIHSQYGAKGLKVIAINLDAEISEAKKFLKDYPAEFDVVFDPEGAFATRFNLQGMPSAVLIGRDGEIFSEHVGFTEGRAEHYEEAIRKVLSTQNALLK